MSGHLPWNSVHLIADLTGCSGLDDVARIETTLRAAAAAAGATVLDVRLHGFGEGQGVTGIALLAESHISIHSWPEEGFAAVDIFICGTRCDPQAALAAITSGLNARFTHAQTVRRAVRPWNTQDADSPEPNPRISDDDDKVSSRPSPALAGDSQTLPRAAGEEPG